jgi:hypothetical protein
MKQQEPDFPPFDQHPDSGTFPTGIPDLVMLHRDDYEYARRRVNFCAGLTEGDMQLIRDAGYPIALADMTLRLRDAEQQRDELRDALIELMYAHTDKGERMAKEAIAKAGVK